MSIRFDASTDLAKRILTAPTYSAAAITFMCWIKIINDRNDYGTVVFFGGSPNNMGIQLFSDGTTLMFWDNTSEFTGSALTVGVWYHITWTKSSSGVHKVYLNGVLDITTTNNGSVSNAEFSFGNDAITEWVDAELDYPRIWQAELTSTEVVSEYGSATPVKSTPWAYYDWSSSTGAATDSSGNSRDLTLTTISSGASRPTFSTAVSNSIRRNFMRTMLVR